MAPEPPPAPPPRRALAPRGYRPHRSRGRTRRPPRNPTSRPSPTGCRHHCVECCGQSAEQAVRGPRYAIRGRVTVTGRVKPDDPRRLPANRAPEPPSPCCLDRVVPLLCPCLLVLRIEKFEQIEFTGEAPIRFLPEQHRLRRCAEPRCNDKRIDRRTRMRPQRSECTRNDCSARTPAARDSSPGASGAMTVTT